MREIFKRTNKILTFKKISVLSRSFITFVTHVLMKRVEKALKIGKISEKIGKKQTKKVNLLKNQ